jgi:hypothetical protein
LHWRGRELSPEFHEYALRVSRGEQLAPFRGQLLADEGQEPAALWLPAARGEQESREQKLRQPPLPWESADSIPLRSKGPRALGLLLLALTLVAVVTGSLRSQEEAPAWTPAAPVAVVAALAPAPVTVAEPVSSRESVAVPAVEGAPAPQLPVPPPPAPAPVRHVQPRKPAPAAPVAAPPGPSTSALLVEKAPF